MYVLVLKMVTLNSSDGLSKIAHPSNALFPVSTLKLSESFFCMRDIRNQALPRPTLVLSGRSKLHKRGVVSHTHLILGMARILATLAARSLVRRSQASTTPQNDFFNPRRLRRSERKIWNKYRSSMQKKSCLKISKHPTKCKRHLAIQ